MNIRKAFDFRICNLLQAQYNMAATAAIII